MADPLRIPVTPRVPRQLLSGLSTPAAGMSVQQRFLDVISQNLANVETTKTADGGPYKRQVLTVSGDAAAGSSQVDAVEIGRAHV